MKRFHRLFLFFAAAVLAGGPAGADTLRIADVPWLGRAALDGSNPYVVTGLVTFVMSWLPGSIILTDPGDPDGPAVYMTDRLYGPILAQGLEDLRPGDLLEMTANPVAMQLEPGLYVSRVSEYAFRVLAVNSIGRGPPSEAVRARTGEQAPSSPPRRVQARMLSASTMLVQWEPPEEPNGLVRGYRVYYTPDSRRPLSAWHKHNTDAGLLTTVGSLLPGITYSLRVLAFTAVGDGPPSPTIQVKTQQGGRRRPGWMVPPSLGP